MRRWIFPGRYRGSSIGAKPILYVFVETELWPNLLRTLQRNGIPSILVNGRLSTRSYERQRLWLVRHFYRRCSEP